MKKTLLLAVLLVAVLLPLTARGRAGYLYEADFSSGSVFQFKPTGEKILFRSGLVGVRSLAFDHSGNLFIARDDVILKVTAGGALSVFASDLSGPNFLAVDRGGNVFASDRNGNVVRFTPLGEESNFASDLDKPTGLAFDAYGNLFVAANGANAIFKYDPAGTKTTFATGLSHPQGLAFDRFGNLYVANPGGGTVEAFTSIGARFTTVYNVASPVGLAFDAADNFYVSDDCNGSGTNTIQKFVPGVQTGETFASGLSCPLQIAFEPPQDPLLNISTLARVDTDPNAELIGGFIITGTEPKTVVIRGIGPSLTKSGVFGALQDPTLELRSSTDFITSNDDWKSSQRAEIQITGLGPKDDRESAILIKLNPGSYTAIVRGNAPTPSGVALVEVYDVELEAKSTLANISTRGIIKFPGDVLTGGLIIDGGNGAGKVIIRALGPSLAEAGVANALQDPTLELRDANAALVTSNDDWTSSEQAFEIYTMGLPPSNTLESAILATLPSGAYTAIVRGLNAQGSPTGTGVGLVEVYNVR